MDADKAGGVGGRSQCTVTLFAVRDVCSILFLNGTIPGKANGSDSREKLSFNFINTLSKMFRI